MARGLNSQRGNQVKTSNVRKAKLIATAIAGVLSVRSASAGIFAWDANGSGAGAGGTGTWNATGLTWFDGSGWVQWPNTNPSGHVAGFGDAAGTVTLGGPIFANSLQFTTTNYVIAATGANTLTLNGTTPTIDVGAGLLETISAQIAGSAWTKTGDGTVQLTNAANSWTGGMTITGGVVELLGVGTNISIPLPAAAAGYYGNGGSININGGELKITPSGTGTTSGAIFTANAVSKPIVFGTNGGVLNLNGRIVDNMATAAFPVALNNDANHVAVIKFNGGNYGLSDLATPANWNLTGSNFRFQPGQLTGTGPVRIELTNGALHLMGSRVAGTANLAMPYTIRGVFGGDPSSGPDGVIQTGVTKNIGRTTMDVTSINNFQAGLFLEDAQVISAANGARAIDGNIVVAGTASGHPGNVAFVGRSTGTAFSDATHPAIINGVGTLVAPGVNAVGHNVTYVGVGGDDTLTIQDGGIAAMDVRQRTDQNFHHGVILNSKTIINQGGKLVFRQSIANTSRNLDGTAMNPAVAGSANNVGYISVQGNIQAEGTSARESVIDLYLPFDNTVAESVYGGVSFETTSNLIVNGTGTGGLRVNGLTRPSGLFGGLTNVDPTPNNQKVESFLNPTRLSALQGTGGYLTIASSGSTYNMLGGSDWSSSVPVGLKVVNSKTTDDDIDINLQAPFTHNVIVDTGATLAAFGQTLGPSAVTPGIGRISGNGTILGPVTVDVGGRVAPGNSVGTLRVTGDLTLNGTLETEVADPANDQLAVSGGLTLGSSSVLDLPVSNTYGYAPYTIATFASLTGTFGSVAGLPGTYSVQYGANDIRLVFIASESKVWTGADGTHPTFWDDNITHNWTGAGDTYRNDHHDFVVFDDTAASSDVVVTGGNVLPSTITVANDVKDYTITSSPGNQIAGTTGLVKSGVAKLTLSGPNTFTGPVVIKNGTVSVNQLTDAGVNSPLGAGPSITLGDRTTFGTGVLQYTGAVNASSTRTLALSDPGGVLDIVNPVDVTFSGAVSGDGGLTKRGAGNVILTSPASSFTGAIQVDQGNLKLASMGVGTSNIFLGTNTTRGNIEYTGSSFTDGRALFIQNGGGSVRISNPTTNLTLNGNVSAPTIEKLGPGTLTLSGSVSLGNLSHTVAEGTLSLTNPGNAFPSNSDFTVPGGATLQTRSGGIGSAVVKLTGGTLRLSTDNSGLNGQFYSTVNGEIPADNTGVNAGGSSIFNSMGNFYAHFNAVNPSATINTSAAGVNAFSSNNAGTGNPLAPWGVSIGSDFVVAHWSGKIITNTAGVYSFFTSSDDGSVMFIDGVKVVDFNRLGGFAEVTPVVATTLTAGVHDIHILYYENAGSAGIEARWTPPGGVKDFLPNNVLLTTPSNAQTFFNTNNVEVTASSSIDNPGTNNAMMGTLTLSPVTLTHTGNGATRFSGTTLTGAPGGIYNFNVGGILDLGAVTETGALTLNKSGTGNLVVGTIGGAGLANGSSINVSGGYLVSVGVNGSPDPLGNAPIALNAGATGLQISSKSGDIAFDHAIAISENVRIAAFATDGGVSGPLTVTLGSAANALNVTGGKTVTLSTDDGYTMNVAGTISGAGNITIAGSAGLVDFTVPQSAPTIAVNAGILRVSTPLTATTTTTVGGLNGNYATVLGNAVLTSPNLILNNRGTWNANIAAGLPAPVTVNAGGILNANIANSLQGVTVTDSGGNAQFFVDGANTTAVNVSAGGTVTGRVADTAGDPANVRTLPAFSVIAAATGNLTSDRDGAAGSLAGRVVAPTVNLAAGTTLNLAANNNTTLHAATINLTGATANIVNSSSDANITIGNMVGATSALTVTGSRRTRVLGDITAASVTVNGTSLDMDPGASGTGHINGAVTVNTQLTAVTGTTDAGTNIITGDPTRSVPGLRASFYQLAAAPAQATIANLATVNSTYTATAPVAPFVAQTTAGGNTTFNFPFINDTTGNPPGQPFAVLGFGGINTFVGIFKGQVFIPPTTTAAFSLRSDDGSMMYFNNADAAFISNGNDHGATTVTATTGAGLTGWRDVVIAYYENGGTAGLRLAVGADTDANAVTNLQLRTLDATGAFGGTVRIESGSTLKAGGFATLGNLTFNGATGTSNLNLSNTAVHNSVVSNVNVINSGAMTLSANNTLSADNLSLTDGGTLDVNGPGVLRVGISHSLGSASTVNVNSGKLILNSAGSGTGAVIVHSTGTIGGGGSLAGAATIQSGGHVAPGNSVGTLTFGGLSLEGGSVLDIEGINTASVTTFDRINITDPDTFLLPASGVASVNLSDLGGVTAGDYVIIDYNGSPLADADVASKFTISTQMAGLAGTIVNDAVNTQVKLHLVVANQVPPQWINTTGGSWGDNTKWAGGVPNANNAIANFLGKITANSVVTLDGSKQVQEVHFDNSFKYTIAPGSGGTLTVGNGSTGLIEVAQGTHEISAGLAFSGAVSKTGPGTLVLSGASSHAVGSSLAVTAGNVNLSSNAGTDATSLAAASANLAVSVTGSGSSVVANTDQSLKSLNLATGNAGNQGFDLNSGGVAGQFRSIHVYAADLDAAKLSLWAAIKNAAANPGDGIFDSSQASHTNSKIGIAKTTDAHGDQSVFIRLARIGDLNLDGQVSIADFIDLAGHFNQTGPNITWQEGDLNYDGQVSIGDFIDLAGNFNTTYASGGTGVSADDRQLLANFASSIGVDPSVIGSAVPEPTTISLLAVGALGLLGRRRRKA